MKPKHLYLLLCVVGTILPYSFFVQFLREHGLNLRLFVEQLFANAISSFFGADVIVSAICLWVFVFFEGHRARVKNLWAPVVASLLGRRFAGPAAVSLFARDGGRSKIAHALASREREESQYKSKRPAGDGFRDKQN